MQKVLISDISSYKGIVIAKFLKKHYTITVVTCDSRKFTSRWHTKYSDKHFALTNEVVSGVGYVNELNALIKAQEIDFYIPCNNKEMDLLLQHQDKIENAFDYWGDYKSFKILNEKNLLQQYAKDLGIRVPETYPTIEAAKVPCVAKPTNESSSKGVVYLFTEADKIKYLQTNPKRENLIVQEYVSGNGAGYSVFAKNGKVLVGYGHIRLGEFPISGGSSVFRGGEQNVEMKKSAEKIVEGLNWSGFAMFEYKLEEGQAHLIEVNPRVWGSINQGLQNECNYFEPILGKPDKKQLKGKNKYTVLSPLIYVSLIKYVFKANFKPFGTYLKNIFNIRTDVNFWTDIKGYFSILLLAKDKYEKNKRN